MNERRHGMSGGMTRSVLALGMGLILTSGTAQEIVKEGDGSYASYTPWCKARIRDANGKEIRRGDQSRWMQTRPLYMTPKPGEPIPTNDWWTDALVSQWTGNLWSYPALVRASARGVSVAFPNHWIDNGTEMKATSRLVFGATDFAPASADIDGWHDWDVELVLRDGDKTLTATLVHGSPFTWIEYAGVEPTVSIESDKGLSPVRTKRGTGELVQVGDDFYGLWRGKSAKGAWIAVGLLPSAAAFETLAPYATAIVRGTRVDWKYDEKTATLRTTWNVTTEDLAGRTENPVALQGFQPHHLKRTAPKFKTIGSLVWETPRGKQRVAAGNSLSIDYFFPGILPYWAVPTVDAKAEVRYRPELLKRLLDDYAARGGFGGDTYWGGKGLFQMAMAMMAARETGDRETFQKAHDRLRAKFEDWLTWTPGEERFYFSYIPRWGGLVGESTSYDSDAFNDHHFHYGYFTYSGALLCLVDDDFRQRYGGMLKLIARDYANWDRSEKRFPLFRTFDPWAGHSFAGGVGDGNGNGQESTSEAMQGWGGLYLLGLALDDTAMRDAGIFGWVSEARGVAEYWFDRDRENIDYTKYTKPYNSNLTCQGVGWWTYFSGDPVWMHSIQWLPNSPALDYLSEDLRFAKWDYDTMWAKKEIGGWEKELGDASLGNVVLSYLQRSDPVEAAKIFDRLADDNRGVARNADTGHLTYWAIHSHLVWGELDWSVRADYPCARAFVKDGMRTFMAYNAGRKAREVSFFDAEGTVVGRLTALPERLTVSPRARGIPAACEKSDLRVSSGSTSLVPPGVILADLARGKAAVVSSEENPGTAAKHLTDGDEKTRWGSRHDDTTMTVTIDLNESAALYGVRLNWEASYAAKYVLEISKDNRTWTAIGGERAGSQGEQKIELKGEKARWVRMRALAKATQYGVSLWSFNVYGRPDSYRGSAPLGLCIGSPKAVLKEGVATPLTAEGWFGTKTGPVTVRWSSANGTFEDNRFTPTQGGEAKVTATVGDLVVERTFPVEEALKVTSFTLDPSDVEIAVGKSIVLKPEARDQFGGKLPLKGVKGTLPKLGTLRKGAVYTSDKPGEDMVEYRLGDRTVQAHIKVKKLSEINLARTAIVTASSEENGGLKAVYAIDGKKNTRWGSAHRDGEWIQLDLRETYAVNAVAVDWENARAVDYDVLGSADGNKWTVLKSVRASKGGHEELSFAPAKVRFIKLLGLRRNTNYGISLFEIAVRAVSL